MDTTHRAVASRLMSSESIAWLLLLSKSTDWTPLGNFPALEPSRIVLHAFAWGPFPMAESLRSCTPPVTFSPRDAPPMLREVARDGRPCVAQPEHDGFGTP